MPRARDFQVPGQPPLLPKQAVTNLSVLAKVRRLCPLNLDRTQASTLQIPGVSFTLSSWPPLLLRGSSLSHNDINLTPQPAQAFIYLPANTDNTPQHRTARR